MDTSDSVPQSSMMADTAILVMLKTSAELVVPVTADDVVKAKEEVSKWEVCPSLYHGWFFPFVLICFAAPGPLAGSDLWVFSSCC